MVIRKMKINNYEAVYNLWLSCRTQGIGSTLVHVALDALKRCGISKVALVVFEKNTSGNAFWEKQSFTVRNDLTYRNKSLIETIRIDT